MKGIVFILCLGCVVFSSCKKTFVCECVEFYNGTNSSWTKIRGEQEFEYRKEEKAIEACNELDAETQYFYDEEYGLNCELK